MFYKKKERFIQLIRRDIYIRKRRTYFLLEFK